MTITPEITPEILNRILLENCMEECNITYFLDNQAYTINDLPNQDVRQMKIEMIEIDYPEMELNHKVVPEDLIKELTERGYL